MGKITRLIFVNRLPTEMHLLVVPVDGTLKINVSDKPMLRARRLSSNELFDLQIDRKISNCIHGNRIRLEITSRLQIEIRHGTGQPSGALIFTFNPVAN